MQSLTHTEYIALRAPFNIADGHAHQRLQPAQRSVVEDLARIYDEASCITQDEAEARFCTAFYTQQRQSYHLLTETPILLYSASIAIHAVARLLADGGHRVGLITPTFDNIPDLLRAQGIEPYPLPEMTVADPDTWLAHDLTAIFLVLPNNPTGWTIGSDRLRGLARVAHERKVTLLVDSSFRYFEEEAPDLYQIFHDEGCSFVVIEDTGKYLPSLDVKAGLLASDFETNGKLLRICEDILLNTSPFVLEMLRRLIEADNRQSTLDKVRTNRATLAGWLREMHLQALGQLDSLSVEWMRHVDPRVDVEALRSSLESQGTVLLPGGPFFWNNPIQGRSYLRAALMREPDEFQAAINTLLEISGDYIPLYA